MLRKTLANLRISPVFGELSLDYQKVQMTTKPELEYKESAKTNLTEKPLSKKVSNLNSNHNLRVSKYLLKPDKKYCLRLVWEITQKNISQIHAVLSYKEYCQILTSPFLKFSPFVYSFCS